MRLLKNTANTITMTFYANETGVLADGTVVVTARDLDDETFATGNATSAGGGTYTYLLPASSTVNRFQVSWSGVFGGVTQEVIQDIEIVGGFLFSLSELRAQGGLEDTDQFPTETLVTAREFVTDLIQQYTGTAFAETWHREVLDSAGSNRTFLDRHPVIGLISVKKAGEAVDTTDWTATRLGRVNAASPYFFARTYTGQDLEITYSYGNEQVPADLKQAALRVARRYVLDSDSSIPENARMLTTQAGTFQLTNASDEYPTGVPEIDSTLKRYRLQNPWGFA